MSKVDTYSRKDSQTYQLNDTMTSSPTDNAGRPAAPDLLSIAKEAAGPLHLGNPVYAAQIVADGLGADVRVRNEMEAFTILNTLLQGLLDKGLYGAAARLLWKPSQFSADPRSSAMIFEAMRDESQVLIQGAASMGKSFSLGVWHYLDWRRDPEFTNIQIVGPSEKHLENNLFSHIVSLHNNAAIPGPGVVTQLCLALDPHDKYAGIKGVVIPLGKKSAGRLQGVKVKPRPVPHPILGKMTRLRVILEEAENIPPGVWEDVINISANVGESAEQFKVSAAYNPKDITSQVGIRAEPVDGWESVDIETSVRWRSKRGWCVLRLDGMKSENVIENSEIYPGLQTKRGIDRVIQQAGGINTPGYYTMARGWYPVQGLDTVVIQASLLSDARGEFEFVEEPQIVAGFDVALEGEDTAFLAVGRYGRASGFRRMPTNEHPQGEMVIFKDSSGRRHYRSVLQVDQLIALPKNDTTRMAAALKDICRNARIRPEWLGIDRTGNGAGVHDIMRATFGEATHGFNPSTSSTDMKILHEDTELPSESYSLLATELWFAVRKWLEVGVLKFSPTISTVPLWGELTGRRFAQAERGKAKVESKAAYKSRGNKSPDRADSLTLLLHTVRTQTRTVPSHDFSLASEEWRAAKPRVGATDEFQYLD